MYKFLGVEKSNYTNQKTGEVGTEYTLSLLGESLIVLRIPVELYRELQTVPQLSEVEVQFGFVKGRFAHYAAVTGLVPARVPAKS